MSDPPPSRSAVGDLVGRLFNYVDTPWKAFAVAGLVIVGVISWVVYEKRNEIIEAWLTPSTPTLKVNEVPAALNKLTEESDADLVQIWSVDLPSNTQKFISARRRDGERPVIPSPRSLPIIVHISDTKALVDVLNGNAVCVNLTASGTPVVRRLAERGMKRGCAIPVPPSPDVFVGVIYLAWATPPEASSEDVAVRVAREIAGTLATH
jgi:hypothetical protein